MPPARAFAVLSNGLSPISSSTTSLPWAFKAFAMPSTVNAVSTVSERANSLSCTATSHLLRGRRCRCSAPRPAPVYSALEAELGANQPPDLGRDLHLRHRRAPRRASRDPPLDDAHLLGGQRRLALCRHERVVVRRQRDPIIQLAVVRPAGDDGAARLAPSSHAVVARQVELALALVAVVAARAALIQ